MYLLAHSHARYVTWPGIEARARAVGLPGGRGCEVSEGVEVYASTGFWTSEVVMLF